ncbi:MAG: NfeD family protein [Armatimonadia bacterium]
MSPALAWMIAGLVLLILEVFIGSFFLMWIGAGALLTALAALLFGQAWVQWLVFAVVSAILLAVSRPLARSIHGRVTVPSNVDSLIGQQAVVLEVVDNQANTGRVRMRSDEWRARSDSVIQVDSRVIITGVEGTTLLVKPLES